MKAHDAVKLYKDLVSGMDQDSSNMVSRIIAFMQDWTPFYQYLHYNLDFYTSDELKLLYDVYKTLSYARVKLTDKCFAYNNYYLPKPAFAANVFYYRYGLNTINEKKIHNKDVIDAGGYIGDSALLFSSFGRNVYSFEPMSANIAFMEQTIALNEAHNIIPIKLGLGSENSYEDFYIHGGGSGRIYQSDKKEKVEIVRLDDWVADKDLDIGLIKADLEGSDFDFLKGSTETIKKHRPVMIISIYHLPEHFFLIKPFIENLVPGYAFSIFNPVDGLFQNETCLICDPD